VHDGQTLLVPVVLAALLCIAGSARAQQGQPAGLAPTHANVAYAPAEPEGTKGHLLDLYLPDEMTDAVPLVIWTRGSAWMADNGKDGAGNLAAELLPVGLAVAGVSVRSSSQTQFPGQLHDIKAAIRWLRSHATDYNIDPDRIAIIGGSSGGWTSAMVAVTGDEPALEGAVGVTGVSSAVQAAVAFFPPTNFLEMDKWALAPCDPHAGVGAPGARGRFCHDSADSPESLLIGCPGIQSCPEKVQRANPVNYVSADDPPIMILHGQSDPLVPHNQGERLYQALNKACHDAVFISLPLAGHGPALAFLTNENLHAAATIRSTTAEGCTIENPRPYAPSWSTIIDFLERSLSIDR